MGIFNYAPEGYLVTDNHGIIKEANLAILSLLFINRRELIGKPITTLIPDISQYNFGMQLNWFSGSQQIEVTFHPSKCAPFVFSLSISPQWNAQNETIGLLWLVSDITERKKIEDELRQSKAELSLVLSQTPNLLWTTKQI